MCVSAISDEMIEAGSIETVKEHGGIRQTIKDENGYLVSENRFHRMTEQSDTDYNKTEISIYRSYENGELYKSNLVFTLDTANRYNPKVEAKGVGQMTKTEVNALLNALMWDEYVLTESKTDKYGYTEWFKFDTKESVEEAKRFAKSKEMANSLIS